MIAPGVGLTLALMDNERGEVVQVDGVVARCLPGGPGGTGRGVGVRLSGPPPGWQRMVERYHQSQTNDDAGPPARRLAILVVSDEDQRRGALALYVTSGWDVRFATDRDTAEEAMSAVDLDAVIAEYPPDHQLTREVLDDARRLQPRARRIVRWDSASLPDGDSLIERAVDRKAGLDALVETLLGTDPQEK